MPLRTPTSQIVDSLTSAIVERRLLPGAKLTEQALADHFGVSRTLVRQALHALSQRGLITLEPARGAFVASPSAREVRQVFEVRRMLEIELTRAFTRQAKAEHIAALREHVAREQAAVAGEDVVDRTELLGDFHVCMATLLGNEVLAQVLRELIARCAMATVSGQNVHDARHSASEHAALVDAFERRHVGEAVRCMQSHLDHVQTSLRLEQAVSRLDVPAALGQAPVLAASEPARSVRTRVQR